MRVKFISTYREWDKKGNGRMLINSFEAEGEPFEIAPVIDTLLMKDLLPGTAPLKSLNLVDSFLLKEDWD